MATEGSGGDWDHRNRLKVYRALSNLLARDIKESASLLVDCIATFSCNEICSYQEFIVYTILSNVLHLPRPQLKEKIIDGPEILSVATDIPIVVRAPKDDDELVGMQFRFCENTLRAHSLLLTASNLCHPGHCTLPKQCPIHTQDRVDQIIVRMQLQSLPECHG